MKNASIILKSTSIFTSTSENLFSGFIAIKDNEIIAVENLNLLGEYIGDNTEIFDFDDKVICPGFVDVHCFFTGYNLNFVGQDLFNAKSKDDVINLVKEYSLSHKDYKVILGHNLNPALLNLNYLDSLNYTFPDIPVVLFSTGCESCWANTCAIEKYKFTPLECYPEAIWRLLIDILDDKSSITCNFKKYMKMLNSRGITAIKEMGFDTFYGFTDVLEELNNKNELTLRVSFMSQPVGYPLNLEFGKEMHKKFNSDFVKFSGYNRMTDGSISELCADLKKPYNCENTTCRQNIDYELIKNETLAADKENFRFSLHAQGDAAIEKVINIYKCCKKDNNGKLLNRHAITDLEFSDPCDLETMGEIGVIAEVYPQIQSLANYDDKTKMINEKIGLSRSKNYWNRRKMIDSNVILSCGTDLPLLIPNIPESIYNSVGGFFKDGGKPYNKFNTISIPELLISWTKNGQFNLFNENKLGTLEKGKLADIVVLDKNIFNIPLEVISDVKVCLTIVNGKIVYKDL